MRLAGTVGLVAFVACQSTYCLAAPGFEMSAGVATVNVTANGVATSSAGSSISSSDIDSDSTWFVEARLEDSSKYLVRGRLTSSKFDGVNAASNTDLTQIAIEGGPRSESFALLGGMRHYTTDNGAGSGGGTFVTATAEWSTGGLTVSATGGVGFERQDGLQTGEFGDSIYGAVRIAYDVELAQSTTFGGFFSYESVDTTGWDLGNGLTLDAETEFTTLGLSLSHRF